jgi:hypothetical protein
MPVEYLVEDDLDLLAYRFHNKVTVRNVAGAITGVTARMTPGRTYRSLLVFHKTTDLSDIGPADLRVIKAFMQQAYDQASITRPDGAIVVDGSLDARFITPLWKAICDADDAIDVHYRFFIDVGPALAWLDVVETPALATLLSPQAGPAP